MYYCMSSLLLTVVTGLVKVHVSLLPAKLVTIPQQKDLVLADVRGSIVDRTLVKRVNLAGRGWQGAFVTGTGVFMGK